ncbi:MAG: PAS domain-containing protein [Clostridia bacterium]|nr:PAS domain-containing protein [Clostridia bacterium]
MDKEYVFDFLCRTAQAVADMFGSTCETLVQDLSSPSHPVLAIYNGHVTGRAAGSDVSVLGGKPKDGDIVLMGKDYVNTLVITPNGQLLKSTTINFVGEDYHYGLGINFDYTSINSTAKVLTEISNTGGKLDKALDEDIDTQLDSIFNKCMASMGKPMEAMKKADRLKLVLLLKQKRAFNFQKSVASIAQKMDVSRYTVYKYLHEIEENELG